MENPNGGLLTRLEDGRQKSEDRRQKSEDGSQKTEDGRQPPVTSTQ